MFNMVNGIKVLLPFTADGYGSINTPLGNFIFALCSSKIDGTYRPFHSYLDPSEGKVDSKTGTIYYNWPIPQGLYPPNLIKAAWSAVLEEKKLTCPLNYALWWLAAGGKIGQFYASGNHYCHLCGSYEGSYSRPCSCNKQVNEEIKELLRNASDYNYVIEEVQKLLEAHGLTPLDVDF